MFVEGNALGVVAGSWIGCVCVVSGGSTSGRALKPGAARLGVVGCESWASGESRFVRRGAADLDNGQVVREW